MKLEMKVEPKYLYGRLSEEFSLEDAKTAFLALMDAVAENKCISVLVDGRGVAGNIRVLERFLYGEFVANTVQKYQHRLSCNPRFAYVLEPPILDPQKLGETVARNRGMAVKTFDRLPDALEFIEFVPTDGPS
jgi:hypothetical protein